MGFFVFVFCCCCFLLLLLFFFSSETAQSQPLVQPLSMSSSLIEDYESGKTGAGPLQKYYFNVGKYHYRVCNVPVIARTVIEVML